MLASSNCSKEIVLNPEHPFQYIVGESPPHTERELGGGEGEAAAYNCTYRISAFDG